MRINTTLDHGHVLFRLASDCALSSIVEEVKRGSSKWLKTKGAWYSGFYWQHGYAAFSVNPADCEAVVQYIMQQEEHHRQVSFQDELRALLQQYGIPYDERYLWD